MAMKYFLFSSEQLKYRREIEAKLGRKFNPGYVIVNGVKHDFTELSSVPESKRYSDSKVVAYADTDKVKHKMPGR